MTLKRIGLGLLIAAASVLACRCGGGHTLSSASTAAWVQVTGSGPSARSGHVAVLDSKRHQVAVFGGAGGGPEVWFFSLDSHTWQEVISPNGPPSLGGAVAVADAQHDRMIIFGGTAGPPSNQLWAFSFGDQSWSSLPTGPSPRFDVVATTDGQHAWFFGGYLAGFIAVNELWQLDLGSHAWTLLTPGVTSPSPRTNSALGIFSGSLYMTGGHDVSGLTPGTWRFDLSRNTWSQLVTTGTPGAGAHFGYDVDQSCGDLILAGGDHDDGIDVATTDFLTLSTSPQFVRLPTAVLPPPRRHTVLVLEPQTRTLFMFGGLQGSSTALGDTWLYHLGQCSG